MSTTPVRQGAATVTVAGLLAVSLAACAVPRAAYRGTDALAADQGVTRTAPDRQAHHGPSSDLDHLLQEKSTCDDGAPPTASYAPQEEDPGPDTIPDGSTMAEIRERGALRVGISADTLRMSARNPFTGDIEGFDIDGPSVEMARHNAAQEGLSDRVVFHETDADRLADHGPFDAAFAFECLHDMPRPVDVLAAMRAATPHGPVVIMDEAVGEQLVAPGDQIERLMYALSLVCCLPDGMSHQPSAATGTVMRPDTLREYARAAGFADVDVLPIEDFAFFRFYSLS